MALPPLPTGSSRNKIEFLYKHMRSGGSSSGSELPLIQGRFPPNNSDGWNTELDGFFLNYDVPNYLEEGDMDIMPLISAELENDKPIVKVVFNLSTMMRLSGFQGELSLAVVLADEQGNAIKSDGGYPIVLELKSTAVHGNASELGQRVTANETGVLLIDKELIQGQEKVFPQLLIRGDAAYTSSSGRSNQEVVSGLFLHYGDITIVGFGVSSTDLTFPSFDSDSPTLN